MNDVGVLSIVIFELTSLKISLQTLCATWMSMAGANVCVTLAAMEKSPLVTILCTMSLEFTMATSFRGRPICFTMQPADTDREEGQGDKHDVEGQDHLGEKMTPLLLK